MILAVALFLLLASVSGASAQGELPPSIDLLVPNPPRPARADGKAHLVYELHVTNLGRGDITVGRVDVLGDNGTLLAGYGAGDLDRMIFRPGLEPAKAGGTAPGQAGGRTIAGGMRAVIWIWVTVDPGAIPGALRHRIAIEAATSGGGKTAGVLESVPISVAREDMPSLDPPFRDGLWLAGNGPSNTSLHRRALIAVDGRARIAQRFAIDWLKFGDDGMPFRGDPTRNTSWYGYGEDVLAAADGVVTEVKDGIPDNAPLSRPVVPITLETVAGNHLMIEHGRGRFALYAHLQPGSLRVKLGEQVRRGQVLGRLGNSGNSDAPHIHFHVCDMSSPLGCEGLPSGIERFEILGTAELGDDLRATKPWTPKPGQSPTLRSRELPLENALVRVPPAPARP